MNYSLYLFGTNKGTFIQYPYDGEEDFLRPLCTCVIGKQLTVHRKGALTHYAFFRQLDSASSQVFGICLVTNGVYIKDIKALYNIFDKIFSRIIFSGKILRLSETGKTSYTTDKFTSDKTALEQTESIVHEIINEDLEPYAVAMPHNFSGLIATKAIALEERNSEILMAIEQNSVVHICPNNDANSSISYVEQTISNLYNENSQLKADYNRLQSQKKQYRNVILLVLAILVCGVGLFFLNGSLKDTKSELSSAKIKINHLDNKIAKLRKNLSNTKDSLTTTREERDKIQQKMKLLKNQMEVSMPIIITDIQVANTNNDGGIETDYGNTIYSNRTMYLKPKITYTGINTGKNIDLQVRLYTPSGMSTGSSSPYGYTYSCSMYAYSGENTEKLTGWGNASPGNWKSGTYRFEIWHNDVCLRAKSFTIY